ncbi:MAG TPA: metallophosphoesterase [Fimbriimonadaceae bacterium]|nr:metallophosphoesterase [Fimbriimonadaceae bacterium]
MRLRALGFLALFLSSLAPADHFQFVVAGDGRADPGAKPPRAEDKNGVNTVITGEMAQAVLKEHAKFLLWTGDLVLGSRGDSAQFETMLLTWRGIMEPLYKRHIPVLACRGNHESGSPDGIAVWNRVFSGKYAMPGNGPTGEKNLTFYYTYGPVLAVGMDQYVVEPRNIAMNVPWLQSVIKAHPKPFIFTFGHEPAFMDGAHKDLLDNDVEKRDAFWETLIGCGARVYFCGHDHLYDHMAVVRDDVKRGPEIHQFVAGTAGAPFYPKGEYKGANSVWKLTRMKNITNTYGYLLVDINGSKATITFKGRVGPGKYEPMDSFSFILKPK